MLHPPPPPQKRTEAAATAPFFRLFQGCSATVVRHCENTRPQMLHKCSATAVARHPWCSVWATKPLSSEVKSWEKQRKSVLNLEPAKGSLNTLLLWLFPSSLVTRNCSYRPWEGQRTAKRQKTSKIVKTCFDTLRHFSPAAKRQEIVKKCQKYFRHFSTIFARHRFSGPFWGPLKRFEETKSDSSRAHKPKGSYGAKGGVLGTFWKPLVRTLSAPKSQRFLRFAIAMPIADPRNRSDFGDKRKQCLHCDLRLRWKVAEPETSCFCRMSGDLAPSTRKLLAIAIVRFCQGPLNGGVSNGGVSRSGLVLPFCPFLSFFGTFPIFPGFPDLLGDGAGIFPIRPFPLSRPIKSTYEEQSQKGLRHNPDLSRKKWEPPGLQTPRFSFSQAKKEPLLRTLLYCKAQLASPLLRTLLRSLPRNLPKVCCRTNLGIVQKVFSEKASAIARMRQKCVKNASQMRQNTSCFIGKRGTFQNASEIRQKCIKNASKTLGGEHLLDDTENP